MLLNLGQPTCLDPQLNSAAGKPVPEGNPSLLSMAKEFPCTTDTAGMTKLLKQFTCHENNARLITYRLNKLNQSTIQLVKFANLFRVCGLEQSLRSSKLRRNHGEDVINPGRHDLKSK